MTTTRKELSSLSQKIQVQTEQPSMELALEGKLFLDVLRIVMHNAEQLLLDVFKRCYSDPRDVERRPIPLHNYFICAEFTDFFCLEFSTPKKSAPHQGFPQFGTAGKRLS